MAGNVLGTLFQGIADAIRGKTGSTDKMAPADFPALIAGIVTGGGGGEGDYYIKSGKFTPSSSTTTTTVTHGLGVVPDFIIAASGVTINSVNENQYGNTQGVHLVLGWNEKVKGLFTAQGLNMGQAMCTYNATGHMLMSGITNVSLEATGSLGAIRHTNANTFETGPSFKFLPGVEYTWVAIAHK